MKNNHLPRQAQDKSERKEPLHFHNTKGGVFPYRYRCTWSRHKDYPHYDGMDLDSYQCPEAIYLAVYLRDMTGS
jgi:hypothetical protein